MVETIIIKSQNHNITLYTNAIKNPRKIVLCLHGFNGNLWGDGFSAIRNKFDDILICSFDSAGHGESEVKSLDMRLDLINTEIYDTLKYLAKKFPSVSIEIMALSYGAYRTLTTMHSLSLPNVNKITFINPALKMLSVLEKIKEFSYKSVKENDLVPMKTKLNKYLRKAFLDDLYKNNVYEFKYDKTIPIKIFIGINDTLIPRQDIIEFTKIYPCQIEYIDDEHCPQKEESWNKIIKYLEQI